jgi:hypothetical protein
MIEDLNCGTITAIAWMAAVLPLYDRVEEKKTPWSESVNELYRPSDHRLSAKLVPAFADRRCYVVSVTDPYGRILGFLSRSRYFSFK